VSGSARTDRVPLIRVHLPGAGNSPPTGSIIGHARRPTTVQRPARVARRTPSRRRRLARCRTWLWIQSIRHRFQPAWQEQPRAGPPNWLGLVGMKGGEYRLKSRRAVARYPSRSPHNALAAEMEAATGRRTQSTECGRRARFLHHWPNIRDPPALELANHPHGWLLAEHAPGRSDHQCVHRVPFVPQPQQEGPVVESKAATRVTNWSKVLHLETLRSLLACGPMSNA
jgi:hypothetical protein